MFSALNPDLGTPRRHFLSVDSTNRVARELAGRGAPHGTLVTATEQSSGRGRQGRAWATAPGRSLLMTLVIREPSRLLSLTAGVAVAETVDEVTDLRRSQVQIKWPNDVLVEGRKVAGILVEGRPQEGWAVLGIGLNVAVRPQDLPPEFQARAGTLGLGTEDVSQVLAAVLGRLRRWLSAPHEEVLATLNSRSYLRGKQISWNGGSGLAAGIEEGGGLTVELSGGASTVLDAGEVHLGVV